MLQKGHTQKNNETEQMKTTRNYDVEKDMKHERNSQKGMKGTWKYEWKKEGQRNKQ